MAKVYSPATIFLLVSHLIVLGTAAFSRGQGRAFLKQRSHVSTSSALNDSKQPLQGSKGSKIIVIDEHCEGTKAEASEATLSLRLDPMVAHKAKVPKTKSSLKLGKARRAENELSHKTITIDGAGKSIISSTKKSLPKPITNLIVISSSDSSSSSSLSSSSSSLPTSGTNKGPSPTHLPPITLLMPISYGRVYRSGGFTEMAQKILHMLEEHDPERLIALPEIDYEPGTSVVRDLFVASLRDLLTGARLNDDIMNLYMVQLTLLDTVSSSVEAEDRRLRSKRVFKTISSLWVSPDVRKKDLNLEGEVTLLWPLFHGYSTEASNHWTLLEIHAIPAAKRKNKASEAPAFTLNLRHYDSLNWKISSLTGLPSALKYLSTQFKTHLILQDVQSWPTPQQSNLKDCGVFVLHMAKRLVLGLPVKRETPVNSELLRAQIAVELLGRTIMIPKFKHVK